MSLAPAQLPALSPARSAALLDILSHHDTYAEAREFRFTGLLEKHGPPFNKVAGQPSSTPAIQILTSRFGTTLPDLGRVPDTFWTVQVKGLLEAFARANLSESYDKGVIGTRRTLSTVACAILEYPVRHVYAGATRQARPAESYDLSDHDELYKAYIDCLSDIVYGDMLEDLFQTAAGTDDPAKFKPCVQAVHEYILINLASIIHYALVLSPKGQYLVKLADRVHRLIPYGLVRQTLRVGNAATMINAMTKIFLTKMSLTSFTNKIGLTANKNEGMNLLQQIISTVLHWDIRSFESRAAKLEKIWLNKEQQNVLKKYPYKTYYEQTQIRQHSQQMSISIVEAIFKDANIGDQPGEDAHKHALELLNYYLNIRDRKEIIRILCQSYPDHLTEGVRVDVAAFDPVIRELHKAVNLSGTIGDVQAVIDDVLKAANAEESKYTDAGGPTVGDFVQVLRKHERALYRFFHQAANGKEISERYKAWAKQAAAEFQQSSSSPSPNNKDHLGEGAGDLSESLNRLFHSLPDDQRTKILPILDSHINYLEDMNESSRQRFISVLSQKPVPDRAALYKSASNSTNPTPLSSDSPAAQDPATVSTRELLNSTSVKLKLDTTISTPSSSVTDLSFSSAPETAGAVVAPASSGSPYRSNPFHLPASAPETSKPGPGVILSRWRTLIENTPITPHTRSGKINGGGIGAGGAAAAALNLEENRTKSQKGKSGDGSPARSIMTATLDLEGVRPEVRFVIECLGPQFREMLGKEGCNW